MQAIRTKEYFEADSGAALYHYYTQCSIESLMKLLDARISYNLAFKC